MTIIAGFNYTLFSILVTDSRLSVSKPRPVARDVCQKVFPLGEAGLIAWSGGLLTGRSVMSKLVERHRADGPWWLLDSDEAQRTLVDGYQRGEPKFDGPQISFVVQLINPWAKSFEDEDWPRVDMAVVDIDPFQHEVIHMGARIRGSGGYVAPRLDEEGFFGKIVNFSSAWPNLELAVINKAMFAQFALEELVRERPESTVGGLYQVAYILPDRVRVLSYERWIPCNADRSYGSFVRLVVEHGQWFQEHPATQRRSRLRNPFIEAVEEDFGQDLVFDVANLPLDSPGVERRKQPQQIVHFLSAHGVAGAPETFEPQEYITVEEDQ